MKKKIMSVVMSIVMLFGMAFSFVGCQEDETLCLNFFLVTIKGEYKEKFIQESFTSEDFQWDNIQWVQYREWQDYYNRGHAAIYLKKHGENRVKDAAEHFKTLEFISEVALGYDADKTMSLDYVVVEIGSKYKEQFLSENFTVEDFKWSNIEKIKYRTWYEFSDTASIYVYLKRQGRKQVYEAVDHLNTLDFVLYAVQSYNWIIPEDEWKL